MSKETRYVQDERDAAGRLIAHGELKHGLMIDGVRHKKFVMREALAGDLFAAEQKVSPQNLLQFNAALWTRTLSKLGSYEGPFTLGMLELLKQADYSILRDAQIELDLLGEDQ